MKSADAFDYRRAGVAPAPELGSRRMRDFMRSAGMMLLCVAALSLAFAPVKQFYLAWVGLVPFFLLVREQRSQFKAFLWGWATGCVFFLVNMWWLLYVTVPGTPALVAYLALFWGLAAMLVRGLRLLDGKSPLLAAVLIAAMWTGLEWVRGNYSPFGAHGLPWLYMGYTQTPALVMCQISDITGVYGVTFWVVLVNALLAMLWIVRLKVRRVAVPFAVTAGLLVLILMYGLFRMNVTPRPGPTVLVIQPNYPQSNNGEKGASTEEIIRFHMDTTNQALADCKARGVKVDLVVWSETMMPPLNMETRAYTRGSPYGMMLEDTSQQISGLADRYRTGFLVGGTFANKWEYQRQADGQMALMPTDHRNSAYFYDPLGLMARERYDKIQLLPFGEFIPFKDSIPWLYHLLVSLGPPDMKYYELTAGAPDATTVFTLDAPDAPADGSTELLVPTRSYRFVTPICFEDIVAPLVTDLLRGKDGTKRADFIVNITNDGWFKGNERSQHFQAATFRSIENRVPTARAVNTGISGFIDPVGRASDLIGAATEGWSVHQLTLDSRCTIYTRVGDLFAELCAAVLVGLMGYGVVQWGRRRWVKPKAA